MPPDITELNKRSSLYLRNIIFGVEDSLVSTVGLLAGIAATAPSVRSILITGIVYIFVEGYAMGAGSYLSEHSAQEYETGTHHVGNEPLKGAVVMFLAFVIAGIIPLAPYLFLPLHWGATGSVLISLVSLGILGYVQAKLSKVSQFRSVVRMIFVGGLAIILGLVIGALFGVA